MDNLPVPQPIPPALRIAVKNGVGGWGPYSVRGIDDLFNSYGFTEADPSVEVAVDTADALAAFVTTDFHQSTWTDQEVGWALGRGLPVVPLNVGANPYGFFGQYQAVPIELGTPVLAAKRITNALAIAVFRRQ